MNDDNDIIEFITETLALYPEIRYNSNVKDQLIIFANNRDGFNITLQSDELKSILYFDDFHINFEHTDHDIHAMIHLIFYALTNKVRLEIFYKNDKPYKFNLKTLNDQGDWCIYKSMQLVFYKFWQKTSSKHLQNQFSIKFLAPSGT